MNDVTVSRVPSLGTVLCDDGYVAGPTMAEQMELASLNGRLAVAQAIGSRTILPDALLAEAHNYASDLTEEQGTMLRSLTERYGDDIVERMMMMQAAAVARGAARMIELRFDGE